jgi:PAB-dependent poly(A)-specific ribonuclease subunit 2
MDNLDSAGQYNGDPSQGGYYNSGYYSGGPQDQQMYEQQQQQQPYYPDGSGGGGSVYNPYAPTNSAEVDGSYHTQQYDLQQQYDYATGAQEWDQHAAAAKASTTTKPGSYYFLGEFAPRIFGYPVNSLAYDAAFESMYVASTTQPTSSTRWRSQRASMLVNHSTTDGMLFSSVAGHPEASSATLQATYECMYGISKTVPLPPSKLHVPSHAYRPPFGQSNVEQNHTVPSVSDTTAKPGHIGINSLLSLDGYVASTSPSAVRIHSSGGLQLHDQAVEGMLCATIHPNDGMTTHASVGGVPSGTKHATHQVHCMDLWQGLRIVSSRAFTDVSTQQTVGVTALATSHERGSIVAGCSDGNIRLLDGSLRELATVKCHSGGISSMAVSDDGTLIATTGYGSRVQKGKETSLLYSFPDPTVYVYDIRYLGRGGIPHPFAGMRGCPHFVSFLPQGGNLPSNRLIVGSGQAGGGLQILVPLEAQDKDSTSFLIPALNQGESISAMTRADDNLALGTSNGRVLQYRMAGFDTTKTKPKQSLEMPPFAPPVPAASLDPTLLQTNDPNIRNGANDKLKSLFTSYILQVDPKVTSIGNTTDEAMATFGSLAGVPIVTASKRTVAPSLSLIQEASAQEGDILVTIPTSKLELDLLANHTKTCSKRYKGKISKKEPIPNPNKLLYSATLSSICYEDGLNVKRRSSKGVTQPQEVPDRYRLKQKTPGGFCDPSDFNGSGLFPGWDYAPTMPNAFAAPVLLLMYFLPEIQTAVLGAQYNEKIFPVKTYEKSLSPELGFVFHQIESLSRFGLLYPARVQRGVHAPRLGAWIPSNFLAALSCMPEAEQLQILDGSPAAVDPPRRPEAFYRFLAYHIDKELSTKNSDSKLYDSLLGIDFVSMNEFIQATGSAPPESKSSTRALTLDLAYEIFSRNGADRKSIRFGDVLQHALCRETRLRAWNQKSKSYETIVQRKIVTSLPKVLTLSCACAGRKEEEGLWAWHTDEGGGQWLPEMVEIELKADGHVLVKELASTADGQESWIEFRGKAPIPESVSKLVSSASSPQKRRYRLDAVLSFIRDESEAVEGDEQPGHHVLHARIPRQYKKRAIHLQQQEAAKMALHEPDPSKLVLTAETAAEVFKQRANASGKRLAAVNNEESDDWVLFNGFVVSNTVVEDARAFHVAFKEPCLVVFRAVDDEKQKRKGDDNDKKSNQTSCRIPMQVMNARSMSNVVNKVSRNWSDGIAEGSLIAFDAEFVSVQEEEAAMNETGSKVTIRETRHALARISVIECNTRTVLLDDHVLPRERVVDYLTRFSGVVAQDLEPAKSDHYLISTRSAYLKLRYLLEQGCIFVGHGLRQDFATVNLAVPQNQIIDTVEIFHQPNMRFISLRFLANHVLGKDMQQDIHDSIEDAMAAFELYEKALEWKEAGIFEKKLQELYRLGQKSDWKLGVEGVS